MLPQVEQVENEMKFDTDDKAHAEALKRQNSLKSHENEILPNKIQKNVSVVIT
jgi:hypothetical protein